MSGGAFDYTYLRITNMTEKLRSIMSSADEEYHEVLCVLDECVKILDSTADIAKAIEWMFSGDSSPESFLNSIEERMSYLRNRADEATKQIRRIKREGKCQKNQSKAVDVVGAS